ncbi:MAG: cupin domain-containing protein [Candidatus Latescibacteria bacterium]|nr:cupin domain-containing protein [bacterium]MBD3424279.1 cupin domain-containing protein [Candidatus Latescibacterota bacterium]
MAELKIDRAINIDSEEVEAEGAENVSVRWLISEKDGAPNFAMRLFEVGQGGCSPFHAHSWEHEVYILEGEGKLQFENEERDFSAGFFIFVPGGKEHSFINTGEGKLKFLCMVPNR